MLVNSEALLRGQEDLVAIPKPIPEEKVRQMQQTSYRYGHMTQFALDDLPNDAVETLVNEVLLRTQWYEKEKHDECCRPRILRRMSPEESKLGASCSAASFFHGAVRSESKEWLEHDMIGLSASMLLEYKSACAG